MGLKSLGQGEGAENTLVPLVFKFLGAQIERIRQTVIIIKQGYASTQIANKIVFINIIAA